jgi:hypothetical protein
VSVITVDEDRDSHVNSASVNPECNLTVSQPSQETTTQNDKTYHIYKIEKTDSLDSKAQWAFAEETLLVGEVFRPILCQYRLAQGLSWHAQRGPVGKLIAHRVGHNLNMKSGY